MYSGFYVRIGAKKIGVPFILEHWCNILEHLMRIFEHPAMILENKKLY